jgi:outer membrane biosynthesis protein TonB
MDGFTYLRLLLYNTLPPTNLFEILLLLYIYFSCAETSVIKEKQSEPSVISGDQLTESSDAEVDNLYEQEVLNEMKEETEETEETEEPEEQEEPEETEETEEIEEKTNRLGICHQILV